MQTKRQHFCLFLVVVGMAFMLSACKPQTRFVAPEIEPPSDLIPGYVPAGFELASGFKLVVGDFDIRVVWGTEDTRLPVRQVVLDSFYRMKSPSGNDILGVHYQKDDEMLLITKSSFPEGSLDSWRENFEKVHDDDITCQCDCLNLFASVPSWRIQANILEVRTIDDTPVAILEKASGSITVFVRGEDLIVVDGEISLDENLRIVESLLEH